jgi:hypothetical protein
MTENNEIWLEIPTNPNYECSNLGRVRNRRTSKLVKQIPDERGYKRVMLFTDGKNYFRRVARLIWETFNDQPCLLTIDHRDRNKENNNLSNLRCISHQDNSLNRPYPGKKNNRYNLTDEIKVEILTKYNSGEWSTYAINQKFGIPSNYICMVMKRGTWNKLLNDQSPV